MWAKTNGVFLSGAPVIGFGATTIGFGAAGDPTIWSDLSFAQQSWINAALAKLNALIVKANGTMCPTWSPAISAATGCFQTWYNANYLPLNPQAKTLRTDGAFDADTLCALILVAALHPQDFPDSFPDPEKKYCQAPLAKQGLSKGAMIGIAAGGAAVLGGIVYVATRKKRRR